MNRDKGKFLGTAFRAAILSGDFIRKNAGSISKDDINIKQASDFVTHIDRESEQIIINVIKKNFPDHRFFTEESIKDEDTGDYRWIIDPLDGTTNYIHSYPVFSVSIALEYHGEIILGIVYDPIRDEIFSAERGKGAFLNGTPFKISSIDNLGSSIIATGFPFRNKEIIDDYLRLFKNLFYRVSDIRRGGSAALDLAYLACGRCEGFFELGLNPWDVAAGSILIEEAGGIISDFAGESNHISTGNIVAGNPALHGEILKEVQNVFEGAIDR